MFPFSLFVQRHLGVPSVSSPTNPPCHVHPTFSLATLLRAVTIDRHQCLSSFSVPVPVPPLYKPPTSTSFVVSIYTTIHKVTSFSHFMIGFAFGYHCHNISGNKNNKNGGSHVTPWKDFFNRKGTQNSQYPPNSIG